MIISFAWTTDALLAGKKRCTRRMWDDKYFQKWVSAYRAGNIQHDAYNKTPRAGGKKVATIRLTCEPYKERLGDMPASDVIEEGGLWRDKQEFIELFGGDPDKVVCVIRFELVKENLE